jgi:hypothetical protein
MVSATSSERGNAPANPSVISARSRLPASNTATNPSSEGVFERGFGSAARPECAMGLGPSARGAKSHQFVRMQLQYPPLLRASRLAFPQMAAWLQGYGSHGLRSPGSLPDARTLYALARALKSIAFP